MTFRKIKLVLAIAALALGAAACATSPRMGIALKRAHLVSQQAYYVPAGQFKTLQFNPPPAPDSDAQKEDLAAVLAWQNKRTEADCAKAELTARFTYDFFWGDKSPFLTPLPEAVTKFFDRLAMDLDSATTGMKERYQRPRPFKAYPDQARPCIKKSSGFSYPSGHAAFSRVFADVLGDIVPERREEFIKKADEVAQDRVIGGVHFPSDIAAGKVFGDQFHSELLKSDAYKMDIEIMKTFLAK